MAPQMYHGALDCGLYLLLLPAQSIAGLDGLDCHRLVAGKGCRTKLLYKASCLPLAHAMVMHHNVLHASSKTEMEILLAGARVTLAPLAGMGFATRMRSASTVVGNAMLVLPCARMVSRTVTRKALTAVEFVLIALLATMESKIKVNLEWTAVGRARLHVVRVSAPQLADLPVLRWGMQAAVHGKIQRTPSVT